MSKTFSWYELLLPRCRRDVKQHWNAQLTKAQQSRQDAHAVVLLSGLESHVTRILSKTFHGEKRESVWVVCVCLCTCVRVRACRRMERFGVVLGLSIERRTRTNEAVPSVQVLHYPAMNRTTIVYKTPRKETEGDG